MLGIEGKMKRNLLLITLIATMVLTACAGGSLSSEEKELVLATGGTGGTYFAVGSAMSTVFNPKLEKSVLSVLSTGGSKENIQLLGFLSFDSVRNILSVSLVCVCREVCIIQLVIVAYNAF